MNKRFLAELQMYVGLSIQYSEGSAEEAAAHFSDAHKTISEVRFFDRHFFYGKISGDLFLKSTTRIVDDFRIFFSGAVSMRRSQKWTFVFFRGNKPYILRYHTVELLHCPLSIPANQIRFR